MRIKENVSNTQENSRKPAKLTVLRGQGDVSGEKQETDLIAGQIEQSPGGHLANPMWLPGHLFGGEESDAQAFEAAES